MTKCQNDHHDGGSAKMNVQVIVMLQVQEWSQFSQQSSMHWRHLPHLWCECAVCPALSAHRTHVWTFHAERELAECWLDNWADGSYCKWTHHINRIKGRSSLEDCILIGELRIVRMIYLKIKTRAYKYFPGLMMTKILLRHQLKERDPCWNLLKVFRIPETKKYCRIKCKLIP